MKIYIVRHGQTDWNKASRWQGNRDTPLNAEGVGQAERIAEALAGLDITRIYSSPLARAAETAAIIRRRLRVEIVLCDAMREIRLGEWEGLSLAEMKKKYGGLFTDWYTNGLSNVGFGVESFGGLQDRALAAVKEICVKETGSGESGPVLLVAHGTWTRVLICGLLGIPMSRRDSFEISNTGLSVLDYDGDGGEFRVLSLNIIVS